MNTEKEKTFCLRFINKVKRERFLFELQSKEKRILAKNRLCHVATDAILEDTFILKTTCSDVDELMQIISKYSTSKNGYFIGDCCNDGTDQPLAQAIDEGINSGMGFAILIDDNTALVREEQVYGPPPVFILKAKL